VSLAPSGDTDVKIYKAKRGGKKIISTVVGLHNYGVPMKDMAKIMGKKFACGSAYVPDDEKYGECIQIQGDVSTRFMDFVESDLAAKYKVPSERIKFEEVKKKKKAEAAEDGDDDEDDQ
jgi:density-regulated protein DRP1